MDTPHRLLLAAEIRFPASPRCIFYTWLSDLLQRPNVFSLLLAHVGHGGGSMDVD